MMFLPAFATVLIRQPIIPVGNIVVVATGAATIASTVAATVAATIAAKITSEQ